MDNKFDPKIANVYFIETFGAFDGPGIRYVLFLQGCMLRCKFCHNRDSWSTDVNKLMSIDEILTDYEKYQNFYRKGGITVSGGEATLQMPFLIELFKECKKRGIHTTLDTSAGIYSEKRLPIYEELFKYTDLILLDIKHIDNEKHKELTGVPNTQILEFAKVLSERKIPTVLRCILIPTINSDDETLIRLRKFNDTLENIVGIDVLPYHKKGIMKWEKLGIKYPIPEIEEPSQELTKHAEKILKDGYKFYKEHEEE